MPPPNLPTRTIRTMRSSSLEQLQQHIVQQEAELPRLRQVLAERRQQINALQRRKEDLHDQLRQIDAEMAALAGTNTAPAHTAKASSRPKARAGRPSPKRDQPSLREHI